MTRPTAVTSVQSGSTWHSCTTIHGIPAQESIIASTEFVHPQLAPLFTSAVAAHATVLADDLGLFEKLAKERIKESDLEKDPWSAQRVKITGVLQALCRAGAVEHRDFSYELTELGSDLHQQAPIFKLWFGAYASVLAGAVAGVPDPATLVRGAVVAESSSRVGAQYLDETLLDLVTSLAPRGRICDLGCGTGSRLLAMCTRAEQPGIGFDISSTAVDAAQNTVRDARVLGVELEIRQADVTMLTDSRPDVDIVTQAFMTHHIAPDDHCADVLRSYRARFPRARYLVVFDTVSPTAASASSPELFAPGFDYIHALRGMEPRTHEAARRVFAESGYHCLREITLAVPNSYAWVLRPDGRAA